MHKHLLEGTIGGKVSNPGYWPITLFSVIWFAVGLVGYIDLISRTPAEAAARFGPGYADIFIHQPGWAKAAFALAVGAGLAGSLGLIFKKAWSQYCFVISLGGLIIYYAWLLWAGVFEYVSVMDLIFSMAILLVAILLVWFVASEKANKVLT